MDEKEIFADVLDEKEKVIAVIRPNRKKYWAFFNWSFFFSVGTWLLVLGFVIPISIMEESTGDMLPFWAVLLISLGGAVALYFIFYGIAIIFAKLSFTKRYYAYTDKRILIRCGIIGVDYKILDYKMLGATSVTVGILDRMLGGKTGYLRFGSASSPIASMGSNGYAVSGYTFAHVDLPYELLREIKKVMNADEGKK